MCEIGFCAAAQMDYGVGIAFGVSVSPGVEAFLDPCLRKVTLLYFTNFLYIFDYCIVYIWSSSIQFLQPSS